MTAAHRLFGSESAECEDFLKLRGNMVRQKFLDALRPDIRTEVLKFDATDLDGTIQRAKNIEMAFLDGLGNDEYMCTQNIMCNNVYKNNDNAINILEEKIKKLEEQNNKLSKQINNSSNITNIQCHICGKNHVTTRCWNYPGNQYNVQGNRLHRNSPYNIRRGSNNGYRGGFNRRNNFLR
jgi:hypothetical protein